MDSREAIEVLKDKHTSIGTTKCDDVEWRKLQPAIDTAVAALEKQIPKKIKNRSVFKTFPMSVHGDCPTCGSKNLSSADTDYCNACGQRLDWSE